LFRISDFDIRIFLSVVLLLKMQCKRALTALTDSALNPYVAPMQLDDPFGDGEPQTGAPFSLRAGTLSLADLFEDFFLIRYRDARPSIGNGNLERAVGCRHVDPHLARVCEFDRVADQIQ